MNKDIKIAVMGCIVNGIGDQRFADIGVQAVTAMR